MANSTSKNELIEVFGPFKLVARFYKGAHRGVLWNNGKKLIEVTGETNDSVMTLLRKAFYNLKMENANVRGDAMPEDNEMTTAVTAVWHELTDKQRTLVRSLHAAPRHCMTETEMSQSVGFNEFNPIIRFWFGSADLPPIGRTV